MNGTDSSSGINNSDVDSLEISLRAYVPTNRSANKWRSPQLSPSEYALIFDTETTVDSAQTLKFGVYQVRKGKDLWEAGFFVNPEILTERELWLIRSYTAVCGYRFMTVAEFIENVFFEIGYELRATIIGFNLPFDISRLAISHGAARGRIMKGGFSFRLSPHKYWPNLQIKHLSPRVSLIRFTTRPGKIAGRGMRNRRIKLPPRPGYFVDLKTFAAALTSRSFNLAGLAEFLKTINRKLETDGHGGAVNCNYLVYAKQDVQVTWECYCELLGKFAEHNFTNSEPHRIFSEASIGKAYLKEMNIRPWREVQPDFPDTLTGIIMSAYFGGRAEVHHRRIISEVRYCDFLSMYPTVCTLMGLWRFVISNGLKWRDSTDEIRELLGSVGISDFQDQEMWLRLATLVQVAPDADIFPVRANYGADDQNTIGLNCLTSETSLWFTLADCIASKLLTGKAPTVIRAITFTPGDPQPDLKSISIAGNADYAIDPYHDDFYRRVIDLRSEVKAELSAAGPSEREKLESTQLTLKILANATSYGSFVELNVEDLPKPQQRACYGYSGEPFTVATRKIEEPGKYFHPLIATLITGAARLMLALTERQVTDSGLDWAFCDTDSMAIAKPANMDVQTFDAKVAAVRDYFAKLNPYAKKGSLLKLEDGNFKIIGGKLSDEIERLYCFAVSSKRYALFNVRPDGSISIRKASGHGLGHLLAPCGEAEAPSTIPAPEVPLNEIGVERWQYDLWYQIVSAALEGHPDRVDLDYHPNLNLPAASRYSAATPPLLSWFKKYNQDRLYGDQVKPSNFLLAFQIAPAATDNCSDLIENMPTNKSGNSNRIDWPKPVAPFNTDPAKAAEQCFDRNTGMPVPSAALKTYANALAQYHLRPEQKFQNGDYTDCGITRRRHVAPSAIRQIGKESNRWEDTYLLGSAAAKVDYGLTPENTKASDDALRRKMRKFGLRKLARVSGISRKTISAFMADKKVRQEIIILIERTIHPDA